MSATGFRARPWPVRVFWRYWRTLVLVHVFRQPEWRYIIPPREWSQELADSAIRRGQELAEKYGW